MLFSVGQKQKMGVLTRHEIQNRPPKSIAFATFRMVALQFEGFSKYDSC